MTGKSQLVLDLGSVRFIELERAWHAHDPAQADGHARRGHGLPAAGAGRRHLQARPDGSRVPDLRRSGGGPRFPPLARSWAPARAPPSPSIAVWRRPAARRPWLEIILPEEELTAARRNRDGPGRAGQQHHPSWLRQPRRRADRPGTRTHLGRARISIHEAASRFRFAPGSWPRRRSILIRSTCTICLWVASASPWPSLPWTTSPTRNASAPTSRGWKSNCGQPMRLDVRGLRRAGTSDKTPSTVPRPGAIRRRRRKPPSSCRAGWCPISL